MRRLLRRSDCQGIAPQTGERRRQRGRMLNLPRIAAGASRRLGLVQLGAPPRESQRPKAEEPEDVEGSKLSGGRLPEGGGAAVSCIIRCLPRGIWYLVDDANWCEAASQKHSKFYPTTRRSDRLQVLRRHGGFLVCLLSTKSGRDSKRTVASIRFQDVIGAGLVIASKTLVNRIRHADYWASSGAQTRCLLGGGSHAPSGKTPTDLLQRSRLPHGQEPLRVTVTSGQNTYHSRVLAQAP